MILWINLIQRYAIFSLMFLQSLASLAQSQWSQSYVMAKCTTCVRLSLYSLNFGFKPHFWLWRNFLASTSSMSSIICFQNCWIHAEFWLPLATERKKNIKKSSALNFADFQILLKCCQDDMIPSCHDDWSLPQGSLPVLPDNIWLNVKIWEKILIKTNKLEIVEFLGWPSTKFLQAMLIG